ncbi:MAG: hypothetical protein J6Z02_04350 [Lachnospiraceae bacterium]|nr:hypothetical protein [Lachnospiraceae bacterium]
MKYKYKQIVLSVTAVVMVVGLAVFSTKPKNVGKANETTIAEADGTAVDDANKENNDKENVNIASDPAVTVDEPTVASDSAVEVNEPEVKEFKANNNPEVTALITEYLLAKLDCSEERLKEVVDDMSKIDITEISRRTEKIESYDSIEVYTIDGPTEGSYIAVSYEKLKISGIKTSSSGLYIFYVKPAADGKLKICFSDVEEAEADEFNRLVNENEDITALSNKVEEEFAKEIEEDEDLLNYYNELNSVNEELNSEESSDEE